MLDTNTFFRTRQIFLKLLSTNFLENFLKQDFSFQSEIISGIVMVRSPLTFCRICTELKGERW